MSGKFFMRGSYRPVRLPTATLAAFMVVSALVAAAPLRAASYSWAISSGDWSNSANWGGTVPSSSDRAIIANGGTVNITQLGETCGTLSLGSGTGSGVMQMAGGGLTVTNLECVGYSGSGVFAQSGGLNSEANLELGVNVGATGTYTLSGNGQISMNSETIGNVGTGTFTQSAGTNNSGSFYVGNYDGTSAFGAGTYNLSNGLLKATQETLGLGPASFTQTGGTNAISGGNDSPLYIGLYKSVAASYTLSGPGRLSAGSEYVGYTSAGTLNQSSGTNSATYLYLGYLGSSGNVYDLSGNGILTVAIEYVGYSNSGSFTQTGGTNNVSSDITVGSPDNNFGTGLPASYGTYTLAGGQLATPTEYIGFQGGLGFFSQTGGKNAVNTLYIAYLSGATGSYNLNGGLLKLSALTGGSGATFNFNGGTLQAGSGFSAVVPMTLGTSGGGATIDTAGYTVTLSGSLSGPGSLTKVDSGTLTMSASNSYTGDTLVDGGTLILDYPDLAATSHAWVDNLSSGGILDLNYSGTDNINALYIAGVAQAPGIWGGPGSGAPNTSSYLAGSGLLNVAVPEPATLTLLAVGALGLLGYGWRRRLRFQMYC
jgi:fibronectin-binding autotransporter adhesin